MARCPCDQCCPTLLVCSTFLLWLEGGIPSVHIFCNEGAGKVLLLGCEAVAQVLGVPVDHVYYLQRVMIGNGDDTACVYSTGFVVNNKEKGLVMKDNVNGSLGSSYGVHRAQTKFGWKEFKGIKFR